MTPDSPAATTGSAAASSAPGPGLAVVQEWVLAWGRRTYRDLPWRRSRDPWAILVSELMLQQTQVARVVPRWEAFMVRFPTPWACAAASVGDVVRQWSGLGYNRRAVNLHRAASVVVDRHGGSLPDDLEALLGLPGVGPYTARAVRAFAFRADVGLVETNSARILARAAAGGPLSAARAQAWADAWVPPGRGWDWNQAVMDLGSSVCRRRDPACTECPIAAACAWKLAGCPPPDPADSSAGVGVPQSTFAGSDRQGRGRLVAALRAGPVPVDEVAIAAGWPDQRDRALRMVDALVCEGLARSDNGIVRLS